MRDSKKSRTRRWAVVCAISGVICAGAWVVARAVNNAPPNAASSGSEPTPAVARLTDANINAIDVLLPILADIELTGASPLNDLVHTIGALGSDYSIRTDDGNVPAVEWILEVASWEPLTRGRPLLEKTPGGWRFRPAERPGEQGRFEAHPGQSLFYLVDAIDNVERTTVRVPPDGEHVPLRSLIASLEQETHIYGLDTSYVLPVLLRLSPRGGWVNRFGERWDADRLLQLHLEREDVQQFCGGAHWCYALAFSIHGNHVHELSQRTRDSAARKLTSLTNAAMSSIDEYGEIHWSHQGRADFVSHQAHTLEWLLLAVDADEMLGSERIHHAIHALINRAESQVEALTPRDRAHVVRALTRYRMRCSDSH